MIFLVVATIEEMGYYNNGY